MFKRHVGIRADDVLPDNGLNILASTDEPVDWGGWREVLTHGDGCCDTSSATALLINHDPNQIAGVLREKQCGEKSMMIRCGLAEGAMLASGISVRDAISCGALRGASVGYTYNKSDCSYDEQTRTVTVNKWRLLELSLTPIPADSAAGIRSFPLDESPPEAIEPKERTMGDIAPAAPAAPAAAAPITDHSAVRAEAAEVASLARSLNLDAAEFVALPKIEAQAAMARAVAERTKNEHKDPSAAISINVEDCDKQADAVADAIGARAGVAPAKSGNPYAGRGIADIAARYARSIGIRTDDWTRKDAAHFALGEISQIRGMRDAANVTTGSFHNFVFLNALTKVVAKGFESAPKGLVGPSGSPIYDTQYVPDFKQYSIGGMGSANLVETPEDIAFPELVKTEGVYSDTAKMWGGTLALSLQALISDDTASFDRALRQVGPIAQKTIERRIIQKLLMGTSAATGTSTWTSNTTSGCTPVYTTADTIAAARANISKANAALQVKVGLDGNPTGNMARFLVAGPTASIYLAGLLGQAPGQIVTNGSFELVTTPWLESSTLTGNSTTSYYAISDPGLVTGLILSKINGFDSVQVQEFDAGAVGARKWKFFLPFEADLFYFTNAASTKVIPGAQQATT